MTITNYLTGSARSVDAQHTDAQSHTLPTSYLDIIHDAIHLFHKLHSHKVPERVVRDAQSQQLTSGL